MGTVLDLAIMYPLEQRLRSAPAAGIFDLFPGQFSICRQLQAGCNWQYSEHLPEPGLLNRHDLHVSLELGRLQPVYGQSQDA